MRRWLTGGPRNSKRPQSGAAKVGSSDGCARHTGRVHTASPPPPTAADLLRGAAAKLRANAAGATPGPRDIEIADGTVHVATFDGQRVAFTGTPDEPAAIANGVHFASWPPEAAVALADWLDAAAGRSAPEETADAIRLTKVLLEGAPMLDDYERADGA
jgi:hypothetical protein